LGELNLDKCYVFEKATIKIIQLILDGIEIPELLILFKCIAEQRAIPPISKFYVGVAALAKTGKIYLGHNIEFPGAPLIHTIHGEGFIMAKLFISDERELQILSVGGVPCSFCRQGLTELQMASHEIQFCIKSNYFTNLKAELPNPFRPKDLGLDVCLLSKKDINNNLKLATYNLDSVIQSAFEAANFSYCPYSKSPSGVAIRTKSNRIYQGAVLENCAYNPTHLPMQININLFFKLFFQKPIL